jgi:hypothetical protein
VTWQQAPTQPKSRSRDTGVVTKVELAGESHPPRVRRVASPGKPQASPLGVGHLPALRCRVLSTRTVEAGALSTDLVVAAEVEVEPQKKIYDEWGRFVARADLWVIGTRRIHEYDGEVHRDREVHRTDLARERRLVEIDWQRVGFTSPQLVCEGGSIIAGMDRLLRTWNPRRLARWEALLDDSLLRSSGRARAMRQWRRSS